MVPPPPDRPRRPRVFEARNRGELCEFFGITPSTINYWRRCGSPCAGEGPHALAPIVAWLEARRKRQGKLAEETRAATVAADPDHEFKMARAQLMRIKLRERRAALIGVRQSSEFIDRLTTAFSTGLRDLARPLAKAIEGLDERARLVAIESLFTELLSSFADPAASTRNGQHGQVEDEETLQNR